MFCFLFIAGMPEGYPRITDHPSLKAVEKDRNTILQCHAQGDPEPSIIWLRDFIPVDLSNPRLTLLEGGECSSLIIYLVFVVFVLKKFKQWESLNDFDTYLKFYYIF